MDRFFASLSHQAKTGKETAMSTTAETIVKTNRELFRRVIAARELIRPETGARFDALAKPDAVADRVLKKAGAEEARVVQQWKEPVVRAEGVLAEAEEVLKRLKLRKKHHQENRVKSTDQTLIKVEGLISAKESEVARLKGRLVVERQEMSSMEGEVFLRLAQDMETARGSAEALKMSYGARLLYVAHEFEQVYESHGDFDDMERGPRRDLAEMVLLITALTIDPDAKEWLPWLTEWQDLPWEFRRNGERQDGRMWQKVEVPITRRPMRSLLFGMYPARWLEILEKAVTLSEQWQPDVPPSAEPEKLGQNTGTAVPETKSVVKSPHNKKPSKRIGAPSRYPLESTIEIIQRYNKWRIENPYLKQAIFDDLMSLGVNGIKRAFARLRELRRRFKKSKLSMEVFEIENKLPMGSMQKVLDLHHKSPKRLKRRN